MRRRFGSATPSGWLKIGDDALCKSDVKSTSAPCSSCRHPEHVPRARDRNRRYGGTDTDGSGRRRDLQRRSPSGRAPRPGALSGRRRRCRGAADGRRSDELPAAEGHPRRPARSGGDERAFGPLGRPLLGQRELGVGAVGWDVSSLEFKLIPFGLDPAAVDGRFTAATAQALVRFQSAQRPRRGRDRREAAPSARSRAAVRRGRSLRSRRPCRRTSSQRGRASSRSPSATTSARSCSRR